MAHWVMMGAIALAMAAIVLLVLRAILRTWVRAGAVLVLLAIAGGFWAWSAMGVRTAWNSATVDGRTVTLHYYAGSCEDQRTTSVDATDRAVTITLVTRSFAAGCDDVAHSSTIDVALDEPLGDRELRDGSCRPPGECSRPLR